MNGAFFEKSTAYAVKIKKKTKNSFLYQCIILLICTVHFFNFATLKLPIRKFPMKMLQVHNLVPVLQVRAKHS